MAERPSRGLADVVAASTALSDIDGRAGRLFYRGYDINRSQEPMEALRSLVSLASAEDPDKDSNEPGPNTRKAARLTAQQPVLVAAYHAAQCGQESRPADPEAGLAASFLLQITGAPPPDRETQILDTCLVLHADHTMNASTFAARVCAATLSDMHSAVVAALGTLKGPLHGGANEQVMRGLEAIRNSGGSDPVGAAASHALARLRQGEKIMGFGHRVYRAEDPRAAHLREMSAELAAASGDDIYYRMSRKMEEIVFAEKRLYPNVDFYAATVYHYLRIPTDLFTSVFSVSRMAGWTSHVMEQHADNRLIRPDSEYIGEHGLTWLPLDAR